LSAQEEEATVANEDVTKLLQRWSGGEPEALGELLPMVYGELRRLARRALSRERPDHTLQPTALVHEAFLRVVPQQAKGWQNREHFFAVCAQVMRQVLVDYARRRRARKRGAGGIQVALEDADGSPPAAVGPGFDLIEIDQALTDLAALDLRRARVVEMRYFAGMTVREISLVLGQPEWDVKKDWTLAKAWLARRLKEAG
jgi:RNA polymerase sigma factor (TIGR02999 family)